MAAGAGLRVHLVSPCECGLSCRCALDHTAPVRHCECSESSSHHDPPSLCQKHCTMPRSIPLCSADSKGASNAALPRDEDLEAFAAISASCGTRAEAEDLLAEIVNAK